MEKSTLKKIAKGLQKDFNTEIPKGSLNLSDLQNIVIEQIKIGADTIDTQEIEAATILAELSSREYLSDFSVALSVLALVISLSFKLLSFALMAVAIVSSFIALKQNYINCEKVTYYTFKMKQIEMLNKQKQDNK